MTPPLLAMLAFECDVVSHNFTAVVVRDAPGASANASVQSPKSRSRSSSSRGLAESLDDSVDAVTFASEGGRAAAAGEAAEDRHRIDSDAEEDLDPMNDPMALLY